MAITRALAKKFASGRREMIAQGRFDKYRGHVLRGLFNNGSTPEVLLGGLEDRGILNL